MDHTDLSGVHDTADALYVDADEYLHVDQLHLAYNFFECSEIIKMFYFLKNVVIISDIIIHLNIKYYILHKLYKMRLDCLDGYQDRCGVRVTENEVLLRIVKLEEQVTELKDLVKILIQSFEARSTGIQLEKINPWTLAAVKQYKEIQDNTIKSEDNPYRPTIKALYSEEKEEYTADEIAKATGRQRNTESAYLYKLYQAGFVKRRRKGNKAYYSLTNRNELSNIVTLS